MDTKALRDTCGGPGKTTFWTTTRVILACGAALALSAGLARPAEARTGRTSATGRAEQVKKVPPEALQVPIIAVSIAKQRLTLYDRGVPLAHAPVSTGVPRHPTPIGIFSIIQKKRFHRSNLYSGAPMPFMQRITWSGIALHAGALPGYPASHGCIRLPYDFAVKLYGMTRIGARVIITRGEIAPTEVEHELLLAVQRKTPPQQLATAATLPVSESVDPLRHASNSSVKTAEATIRATDAVSADQARGVQAASAGAERAPLRDLSQSQTENSRAVFDAMPGATNGAAPAADAPGNSPVSSLYESFGRPLRPGPISVFISRKEGRLFVRKGFQPLFDVPVEIARRDEPLGTHLFTAVGLKEDGRTLRWVAVSLPGGGPKEALRPPKEKRKHAAWEPRGPAPANEPSSLPPSLTAAEALGRIDLPQAVLDQIGPLVSVGASLIISDHGLGHETGKGTDFIITMR